MLLDWGVGDESWESLGLQEYPTGPSWGRSVLGVHWKDWCWGWSANTLVTWWDELAYLKRPWCWERLRAGGEGDNRRWDGRMVGWVWVNSKNLWWTGRPGMLQFMGLQRVGHNWVTELNWTCVTYTEIMLNFAAKYCKCNRLIYAILGLQLNNTLNISCMPCLPCKNNIISDFWDTDIWKQIMTFVDMVIMSER